MLKVESIVFTDKKNRSFTIHSYQLESFPLVGGEESSMINTKVWNQHGNTPIAAYMESFEGELIFALYTADRSAAEIESERRQIINICNPLNKTIVMKMNLNSGASYYRDITFVSAPIFPIGLENRNEVFQKVQLMYEANNPFWYAENEIVESFQAVEPNFFFPFTMSVVDAEPIIFGTMIPANIATNEGQAEAPIIIKIVGACTNPLIENKTTGEFIKFKNLTMSANDELLIDTTFGQKQVLLNGENAFNKLDYSSTFFNLIIGDNEIEFTDDTGSTTATIHFIYKNLYITI